MPRLQDLRLGDLLTLLAVQRTGSISGAARELRVTPSQVSKAMTRLERHVGVRLLSRGARGVVPTSAGRLVLPRVTSAVEALASMAGVRQDRAPELDLTIAAPSYLVAAVLPVVLGLVPGARVRGIELAPAHLRATIASSTFDAAMAPGGIEGRPAAWTSDHVGAMKISLFGRPAFVRRLGPTPLTVERVRPLPFIGPTRAAGDGLLSTGDDCPLSPAERWIAHEVQTIGAALELASRSDCVVFGPRVAARRLVEAGALVEIPVAEWDVTEPLHVLCNGDRVLARVRTALLHAAKEAIA